MTPKLTPREIVTIWRGVGERGLSSDCIARAVMGEPLSVDTWGISSPHDPADLRRCLALLDRLPIRVGRAALKALATESAEWEAVVSVWGGLVRTLRREMKRPDGMAPDTYRLMRLVLDHVEDSNVVHVRAAQ